MGDIGMRLGTTSGHALKLAETQPHKRPWLGWWLTILFYSLASVVTILLLALIFALFESAESEISGSITRFVFIGCALIATVPFYPAYHFGKKLSAKGALEILQKDSRAPILYLRSFDDDRGGIQDWWLRGPLKLAGATRSGAQTPFSVKKTLFGVTSEDALVSYLNRIGPVVAIGRPFETLPTLGAARLYMDESGWQDAVKGIAHEAQFVVLGMGATGGLRWEYEFAFSSLPADKIVIYLDVAKGKAQEPRYAEFRAFMAQSFNIDLPAHGFDAHAIRFDPQWRPLFIRDQFRSLTDLKRRAIALSPHKENMSDKDWACEMAALQTIANKAGAPVCIVPPNHEPPETAQCWAIAETAEERLAIARDWAPDAVAVFTSAHSEAALSEFTMLAKESGDARRWVCSIRRRFAKSVRASGIADNIIGFDRRLRPFSGVPRFLGFDGGGRLTALRTKWWPSIGWLGWILPNAGMLRKMGVSALQPYCKAIGRKTPGAGYRRGSWIIGAIASYIVVIVASAGDPDPMANQDASGAFTSPAAAGPAQ